MDTQQPAQQSAPFSWQINIKKALHVFLVGGANALGAQAVLIPDSTWAVVLQSIHVDPRLAFLLTLFGLPAVKSIINYLKNVR